MFELQRFKRQCDPANSDTGQPAPTSRLAPYSTTPLAGCGATVVHASKGSSPCALGWATDAYGSVAAANRGGDEHLTVGVLRGTDRPFHREGRHPSFDAKPHSQRAGFQDATPAPGKTVDQALLEKVRQITSRDTAPASAGWDAGGGESE